MLKTHKIVKKLVNAFLRNILSARFPLYPGSLQGATRDLGGGGGLNVFRGFWTSMKPMLETILQH